MIPDILGVCMPGLERARRPPPGGPAAGLLVLIALLAASAPADGPMARVASARLIAGPASAAIAASAAPGSAARPAAPPFAAIPSPAATPSRVSAASVRPSAGPTLSVRSAPPAAPPALSPGPTASECGPLPLVAVARRAPSVFEVWAEGSAGIGRGTAFAVVEQGGRTTLATSAHVVHEARRIWVRQGVDDWVAADLAVDLLETNPGADLALPSLPGSYPPVPVTTASSVGWTSVLGHGPGALRAETGRVRRVLRDGRGRPRLLEMGLPLRPGDSGAPILDGCGRASGVATAVIDDDAADLSYAVALDGIAEVLAGS